jgi:RNA polymerase sigma-70 factor (ECF subfamily)
MTPSPDRYPDDHQAAFERLVISLRPPLHRYCARMTGSVIDGEDVLQEALLSATEAYAAALPIANPEGWLFRIAHNAAVDFLRRRVRQQTMYADEEIEMLADRGNGAADRQIAAASLRTFMRLSVVERSAVILMDVIGYTIQEISGILGNTVPSVKAALHRGRERLREFAAAPEDHPLPMLRENERARLFAYVDRFNARDFDAIRDLLADEVQLDLVSRLRRKGREEVGAYFINYAGIADWWLTAGLVDGRPAILVGDADDRSAPPRYFVLVEWADEKLVRIRDFRYARYAIEGAELAVLPR